MACRSILGPALGGALAQPVLNYPSLFSRGSMFDTYPFLLPNLVCVAILACGLVVGTLFLRETHADHKHRRDPGIALGGWLLRRLSDRRDVDVLNEKAYGQEEAGELKQLLAAGESDGRSSESSCPSNFPDSRVTKAEGIGADKAFTRPVIMNIVAYGIMA